MLSGHPHLPIEVVVDMNANDEVSDILLLRLTLYSSSLLGLCSVSRLSVDRFRSHFFANFLATVTRYGCRSERSKKAKGAKREHLQSAEITMTSATETVVPPPMDPVVIHRPSFAADDKEPGTTNEATSWRPRGLRGFLGARKRPVKPDRSITSTGSGIQSNPEVDQTRDVPSFLRMAEENGLIEVDEERVAAPQEETLVLTVPEDGDKERNTKTEQDKQQTEETSRPENEEQQDTTLVDTPSEEESQTAASNEPTEDADTAKADTKTTEEDLPPTTYHCFDSLLSPTQQCFDTILLPFSGMTGLWNKTAMPIPDGGCGWESKEEEAVADQHFEEYDDDTGVPLLLQSPTKELDTFSLDEAAEAAYAKEDDHDTFRGLEVSLTLPEF